ncbi:MAG TPA: penicillin-binding transpeptidase domain-containing protein [Anaeromyxobacteraceae bacterium]|nr:penicillin-binding transpeptidase domain-containing protein [Anaeromyxobacteraceae bacterium]
MSHLRLVPSFALAGGVLFFGVAGPFADTAAPATTPAAIDASGDPSDRPSTGSGRTDFESAPDPQALEAPTAEADAAAHRAMGAAASPFPAMGQRRIDPISGRYVAPIGAGRATLTLDPALQDRLDRFLASYGMPFGAVVVLEPSTGRVLAMAEHSKAEPDARDLSLRALAPAASIFKIVTASALLRQGVPPDEEVCYHGGRHRLKPGLLEDDPRRDHRCTTLSTAMGKSVNVVFAKLASRGLTAAALRAEAGKFLFDAAIPFARPVEISKANVPDDEFGLANTAAGFGDVRLSPLHGALIAAIVANGGLYVPPVLVDAVAGATVPPVAEARRVVEEDVAKALADMMETTVTEGTARRAFRRAGGPSLRDVTIAGKTGSLAEKDPFRDYSWFVGFAPVENPRIAVAAVVVNGPVWRVKASTVAREAFAAALKTRAGAGMQTASAK